MEEYLGCCGYQSSCSFLGLIGSIVGVKLSILGVPCSTKIKISYENHFTSYNYGMLNKNRSLSYIFDSSYVT